jgi:hypothetical protein
VPVRRDLSAEGVTMNRRNFFKMLGAAAAVTAVGIIVPELIVPSTKKFFLPPPTGWASGWHGMNVGDVIEIGLETQPRSPLQIRRCKQFVVTSITNGIVDLDRYRYDAVYTLPSGEEVMRGMELEAPADDLALSDIHDRIARDVLESDMRKVNARPGGTHFKLNLPHNHMIDARYI